MLHLRIRSLPLSLYVPSLGIYGGGIGSLCLAGCVGNGSKLFEGPRLIWLAQAHVNNPDSNVIEPRRRAINAASVVLLDLALTLHPLHVGHGSSPGKPPKQNLVVPVRSRKTGLTGSRTCC